MWKISFNKRYRFQLTRNICCSSRTNDRWRSPFHPAAQVCQGVGGCLAAPQTPRSVRRLPALQRHHALSDSFPLPVPGLDKRQWGVGPCQALYGVPGPGQSGLPEVGFWQSARNNYIPTGSQHNRLGGHWLQSEWRNEGLRSCHRRLWNKWKLLCSKSIPLIEKKSFSVNVPTGNVFYALGLLCDGKLQAFVGYTTELHPPVCEWSQWSDHSNISETHSDMWWPGRPNYCKTFFKFSSNIFFTCRSLSHFNLLHLT